MWICQSTKDDSRALGSWRRYKQHVIQTKSAHDTNNIGAWYKQYRRVISGHSVCYVTSRTQSMFITKKSSWMRACVVVAACCTYAIALIYHSAVHVQWHRPPSFIIHDLTLRHPPCMRVASFYSVYNSCISSPSPSLSHLRFLARAPQTLSCSFLIQQYVVLAAGCPILPIYTYARHPFWLLRWKARCVVQKSSESTLRKVQGNRVRFHLYQKFHSIYISRCDKNRNFFKKLLRHLKIFIVTLLRY